MRLTLFGVLWVWLLIAALVCGIVAVCNASPASDRRNDPDVRKAMAAFRKTHTECFVCQAKGSLLRPLEVAHVKPVEPFPQFAADTNNMAMLCHGCHYYLQHVGGNTRRYTVNFFEWIALREVRP